MNSIFEVTNEDIEKLDASSLTALMFKLLYSEAASNEIPKSSVSGSLNITIKDGGKDGGVTWDGFIERTDWFPTRDCLFQNKAGTFGPTACHDELFQNKEENILKPMLEDIGINGKHYIIFNNKSLTDDGIEERKDLMLAGFKKAGKDHVTEDHISFYGSAQIADWTNQYYSAIIYVKEVLGQNVGIGFKTWEKWSGYAEHSKIGYVEDDERAKHTRFIKEQLIIPKMVIRLIGLSGLGKSRMVLEAFRPPQDSEKDLNQEILNKMVSYVDCQYTENSMLPNHVMQLINLKKRGILIFDNCDSNLHNRLASEIKHSDSNMSMISIDNDPSEDNKHIIRLDRLSDRAIEQIIGSEFPNLIDDQIAVDKIIELSGGFPKIASLLIDSYLNNEPNVGSLTEEKLVAKMIGFPLDITQTDCKILCALSVFNHIGFKNSLEYQLRYVAENLVYNDLQTTYTYLQKFIKRTIIDERDKYIQVVPKPLAIRLAEEWWKDCVPSKAQDLFTDHGLPTDMLLSLCKQFRHLDDVSEVREIADTLCKDHAPFGQAEVLFSERGSMVFRYFVEVNPQATVNALYKVIVKTSLTELKAIKGRRNLVIALEMLCFWKEQFNKAAKCLMYLALAESETWANNATGQFIQLFQIVLSGANASYEDRLIIVDELIQKKDEESIELAIKALRNVIHFRHAHRSCGSEHQGTKRELKEWEPETHGEILDYVRGGLNRLLSILEQYPSMEELVKEAFDNALLGLLQLGLFSDIESFVADVTNKTNHVWRNLLQSLIQIRKYDILGNAAARRECIEKCIEILNPTTIEEKIKTVICRPPYDIQKDEKGKNIDISGKNALDLLVELVQNKVIYDHLNLLLDGEQRYGLSVGYHMGKTVESPRDIFISLTNSFKKYDLAQPNIATIAGLLVHIKEIDGTLYDQSIQEMYDDSILKQYLFEIIRRQILDADDLKIVEKLLDDDYIDPNQLRLLSYGSVLKHCVPEHVQKLLKKAIEVNTDFVYPAIDITAMYLLIDDDEANFNGMCEFAQELLMKATLSGFANQDSMCMYHRHLLLKKVLKLNELRSGFLGFIFEDIYNYSKDVLKSYSMHSDIRSSIFLMLEKRFDESWSILSSLLLKPKEDIYGLLYLLNPKNEVAGAEGLDSILPEEAIIDWCKKEKRAYEVLPLLINVLVYKNDIPQFHELIIQIIELGLYNQSTLDNIFSNMMPRSWSGSLVPILDSCIALLESLRKYKDSLMANWIETNIEDLKGQIKDEKERNIEDYFRYYT